MMRTVLLRRQALWGLFILYTVTTPPSHAIVNIEEMRTAQLAEGWSGNASLAVNGAAGNTDKIGAATGGRLYWHRDRITRLIVASYSYGESNRKRDANKGFIHLRHITQQTPTLAFEFFTQATRNEFSRLSLRALLGAGTRHTLRQNPSFSSHLGLGAFFVRETLEEHPDLSDHGTDEFWRANLYLALNYRLNGHVRLGNTIYYQPALNNGDDYRLLNEGNLKVKLNDELDLKLSVELSHDSEPPQLVEKTDITYNTGVEYHF